MAYSPALSQPSFTILRDSFHSKLIQIIVTIDPFWQYDIITHLYSCWCRALLIYFADFIPMQLGFKRQSVNPLISLYYPARLQNDKRADSGTFMSRRQESSSSRGSSPTYGSFINYKNCYQIEIQHVYKYNVTDMRHHVLSHSVWNRGKCTERWNSRFISCY